jgi:uncharacterized membrane protein YeaQ/YmgE (transglycosylase-associated protein family)
MMPLWMLIVWIVVGGVMGVVAPKLLGSKSGFGLIGDVLIGIVGAVAGGYGMSMYGSATVGGAILSVAIAAGAALAILWASRQLKKPA